MYVMIYIYCQNFASKDFALMKGGVAMNKRAVIALVLFIPIVISFGLLLFASVRGWDSSTCEKIETIAWISLIPDSVVWLYWMWLDFKDRHQK